MPSERPAGAAPTERSVAPGSAPADSAAPAAASAEHAVVSTTAGTEPSATSASAPAASPGIPASAPGLGSDQSAVRERTAGSRRALAVVPGHADGVATATESTDAPKRVTAAGPGLPDARAWGGRLAQAVSEVLAGDRPISQLVRFTDEAVFADLNRRVRLLGLTTTATARGAKERSSVCSVRICTPAEEIAEIAAHVRHGDRSRAIALRLEIRRNRWICTALELG
nr:Rv3235 family protein [Kribbella steppae]